MAESGKKPPGQSKKSMFKDVQRGTHNELEILAQIVVVSPMLRQGVLERVRAAKKRQAERDRGTVITVSGDA